MLFTIGNEQENGSRCFSGYRFFALAAFQSTVPHKTVSFFGHSMVFSEKRVVYAGAMLHLFTLDYNFSDYSCHCKRFEKHFIESPKTATENNTNFCDI